jgi:hypothetical protein
MTSNIPRAVPATTPWLKAVRSQQGANCVELRRHAGSVEIRDSKDPAGPRLRLTGTGLTVWLDGARHGNLDHLLD